MRIKKLTVGLVVVTALVSACSGELVVDTSSVDVERWVGNAPDCPAEPVPKDSPCVVAEGQTCIWYSDDPVNEGRYNYQACACREANSTTTFWHCFDDAGGLPVMCPETQPEQGASCTGFEDAYCRYPRFTSCECREVDSELVWSCTPDPAPAWTVSPPSVPEASKPINQLSDEERTALCNWMNTALRGPDADQPPENPLDNLGFTTNQGCNSGDAFPCWANAPHLPLNYCKGNLSLSTCAAPVEELVDCVTTLVHQCAPAPHGCGRYLEKPGCDGTLVNHGPVESLVNSCPIRVQ